MSRDGAVYQNRYFEIQRMADGVFAVLATRDGGAVCNSGIVDLGGKVVVFDALMSLDAAEALKNAVRELTGKETSYVVNSHGHLDHAMGNNAFPGSTPILASAGTYAFEEKGFAETLKWHRENGQAAINELQAQYEAENDEANRRMLANQIAVARTLSEADYEIRLPDVAFEGELTLYGSARKAKLTDIGSGHTQGDTVLLLPEERLVFTGDLLFVDTHPWLGSGNPHQLLKTIDRMLALEAQAFIPGHGPLGGKEDLKLIGAYVAEIEKIAVRINRGELALETVNEKMLPEPFSSWKGNKFRPNLQFYCDFVGGGEDRRSAP